MALSEKQFKILAFPYTKYDALIADGSIRSGKSSLMTVAFVDDAMRRFNSQRFGICGKTVDSTIKNIIEPYLALVYARRKYTLKWSRSDKVLVVSCGNTTNIFEVFGGKDESSFTLIQGRTLAGVFLDEVALQPRSFVEQALARCSVPGSKYWFNCNPDSPNHWFYKEWICKAAEKNALHLHFRLEDNPSLTPEIIARYYAMYSGVFFRRYILGEWCATDGLIYPLFADNEARYMIDFEEVPKLSYIEIGADVGGTKSQHAYVASGYTAQQNIQFVLASESYDAKGVSVTQYRDRLISFADVVKTRYGFIDSVWVDNAEAAILNELDSHTDYNIRGSIKDEIIDRIRCTDILLSENRIKIVRGTNDALCDGLRTAVWHPDKDNVPLDDGSYNRDIIDAFDYSMTPHITQLIRG